MNRAATEEMTVLREMMQSALDAGVISDRSQLLAVAAQHGLTVTRNGSGYAGFMTKSEKRFRVRFVFNDYVPKKPRVVRARAVEPIEQQECAPPLSSSEAKPQEALAPVAQPSERKKKKREPRNPTTGFWIYALTARSEDGKRKACYVGQAARMAKRFGEHYRQKREGRGSYSLFCWAEHEKVEVQAVVLTWAEGTQSNATYFEGYWLQRALNAGFEAPDVHNWGKLPRPSSLPGQPEHWPTELVHARSISLLEVVMQRLTPKVLFLDSAPAWMVQLGLALTLHLDNAVDRFA